MSFRFKHFTVEDNQSTLKIGTDAMLLGAWANPGNAKRILDIGSGCGVLALMMAQKSNALIDAIDIDQLSADQARENFDKSPWSDRIVSVCCSLDDFRPSSGDLYDYIISNPPYFSNQLKSKSVRLNRTKHEKGIEVHTLVKKIHSLLRPDGKFSVIFPYENHLFFINVCEKNGFHILKQVNVHSKPRSCAGRTLMEFGRTVNRCPLITQLCILNENGKFTDDYLTMTADFHYF